MAVYYILPIFARVTTKTNYMKFRKLRIIQAAMTNGNSLPSYVPKLVVTPA